MKNKSLQCKKVISISLLFLLLCVVGLTKLQAQNIVFADNNVKAICVANWDTSGDNELSYAEAAAVTDLENAFYDNHTITSFNELQYFTGLTHISFLDFHNSSVTSLVIPESVTSINNQAFYGCDQLTSVNLPSGITVIGWGMFQYCRSLVSITIPAGVTYIDAEAFQDCIGLTSITLLAAEPVSINEQAFENVNRNIPVYVPCGSLSAYQNAEGWSEFTNFFESCSGDAPVGAINGLFSVGENTQVYFSQGNLQYQASTNTWQFAEHQWDFVGEGNTNASSTYEGWIDLFAWGTSGYDLGTVWYQPWSSGGDNAAYGCNLCDLSDYTGQADWGYNAISNGGNQEKLWRTCSSSEWWYLLEGRETTSGIRYVKAVVNGINGLVLLPDNWNSSIYELNNVNEGNASYEVNVISSNTWSDVFEVNGAVFLPAAGRIQDWFENDFGIVGFYWSSSSTEIDYLKGLLDFNNEYTHPTGGYYSDERYAVRLIRHEANASYIIEAVSNPAGSGTITGTGTYGYYDQVALTANANAGYAFVNWTESGQVVSTDATYSFTVTGDRNLMANFYDSSNCPLLYSFSDDDHTATVIGHCEEQNISGELVIPETVLHNGETYTVTAIGELAFYNCDRVTSLEIPGSVTFIPGSAFAYCNGLEQITVALDNTTYDSRENCNAIIHTSTNKLVKGCKNTVIPNTVTSLDEGCFWACDISSIVIPNSVISIGNNAFEYCNVTAIEIPNSVISIGDMAFYCSTLTTVSIGSSLSSMVGNPFANCNNLAQITVSLDNTTYDSRENCNAIIETSNNKLVVGCKNTVIPNTVTSIGYCAFYNCQGLTSVVIPSSVTTLDEAAFVFCSALTSITLISAVPPTLNVNSLGSVDRDIPVYIPCGSLSAYQNAEGWNEFTNFIEMCPREVAVTTNHAEYGTVSGGGSFEAGETCTVTATPNDGYYFLCWMEDGQGVSTEATYTFPVYRDHDLTAVFYSSLGEEMVINGDFEQGNVGFISEYWYYYAFGGAGQYYVDNNTHYPGLGHGGTGNFMMIDGATEPNVNIWTEEISVVPNTYYTLSTWVCTLNPESLALLQFSINGTQIGCVTAPSQTNTWQQYITLWYSGNATAATITIIDQNTSGDGNDFGVDDISFREIDPSVSGGDHAYVDLGLPSGTLWATCNIGADAPEDYGDYFAWGETQPKDNYDWNTYQYCMGNGNALTKYCNDPDYGYNGFTDTLTILLPEDDAATANWGNSWRMPTKEEFDELYLNTTWTRTTLNGVNGCLFTALNGNSIFLPAASAYDGSSIGDAGSKGNYWSSSLDTHYPHFPYRLYFDPNYFFPGYSYSYRFYGHPVRPVRNAQELTSFHIHAVPNPAEGGTITGAGNYEPNATCTLTATANEGYIFVNWTKDGAVVSTSATYSFTVTESASLVANFAEQGSITNHWSPVQTFENTMDGIGVVLVDGVEQQSAYLELGIFCGEECRGSILPEEENGQWLYYFSMGGVEDETFTFRLYDHVLQQELELVCGNEVPFEINGFLGDWNEPYEIRFYNNIPISVTVNPEGAGTVTGAGDYPYGSNVTLSATANTGFAFKEWSINGQAVSTETTLTITIESPLEVTANFDYMQEYTFSTGWNWWSTYIELSDINGLEMLEAGLGESGVMIKTNGAYARKKSDNTWFGSLRSINNETGYKVQTSSACALAMTGALSTPTDHTITISANGWTWIGYPIQSSQGANAALSAFEPENKDIIKGQNGYARYDANTNTWKPTSFTLIPGKSYLYYSNANEVKSLVWTESRSSVAIPEQTECSWRSDIYAYPDNSTVQAVVLVDGNELQSDAYELGAFVDGICRGSAILSYDAYYDRYFAMMTITGEDDDNITFRLIDKEKGEVITDCETTMRFVSDGIVGDFDSPYEVRFTTKANNTALLIYPNPVERNTPYTFDLPMDETVEEIVVFNTLGDIVSREAGARVGRSIQGITTTGVYTVKITCRSGNTYTGRIVVR